MLLAGLTAVVFSLKGGLSVRYTTVIMVSGRPGQVYPKSHVKVSRDHNKKL